MKAVSGRNLDELSGEEERAYKERVKRISLLRAELSKLQLIN
jgi:hypothetical protein